MNIEGQDIETYKTFVVPLDDAKLNLPMRNDPVTSNKKKNTARSDLDDEEKTKDSE